MTDSKISALPAATTLAGTEVVPVVQRGSSKKATVNQLLAGIDLDPYATTDSPTFTGSVTIPTPSAGSDSTLATTTAWVRSYVVGLGYSSSTGTVTSVGLTLPDLFSVSGSPVTTSGTLAATLATQAANVVLAGPATGSAAVPTFRALVAADLPATAVTAGSYTNASVTVDAAGRLTAASNGTAPVTSVSGTAPISSSGGATPAISISAATTSAAGSMSSSDKTKLDGVAAGAQVNIAADLSYTASTRLLESSTGTDVTLPLVTSTNAGLAPASGGGTTTFLRADGTWSTAGSPPGGSTTQLQFNDSGGFGGDADLTWNKTTNVLGITGDVNLSDGGTYTTTLQTITPTAARTISFPDATGTVALVGGSSGQLLWNNAGAVGGASTLTYDGSILTTNGRFINSYNATASSPAKAFTGTWFTGGTATTTKPQVLIEPTGTTSTAWSTSGTGLGVNASSGFAGNLLDLQVNGSARFSVLSTGYLWCPDTDSSAFKFRVGAAFDFQFAREQVSTGALTLLTQPGFGANKFYVGLSAVQGNVDCVLERDAANTLAQRNGTAAQTFRCYNTWTSSTNYELGKLEWSSNVFRIGTEKGSGGGTARTVEVHTDSIARLALDTTGSVRVVTALTVATLPGTPAVGMVARVTDATAPAMGVTVVGGGAAAALVWYNGANWSVIGV